jgi:hypothetical protein
MVKSLYLRAFVARSTAIPAIESRRSGARRELAQGSITPKVVRPEQMASVCLGDLPHCFNTLADGRDIRATDVGALPPAIDSCPFGA